MRFSRMSEGILSAKEWLRLLIACGGPRYPKRAPYVAIPIIVSTKDLSGYSLRRYDQLSGRRVDFGLRWVGQGVKAGNGRLVLGRNGGGAVCREMVEWAVCCMVGDVGAECCGRWGEMAVCCEGAVRYRGAVSCEGAL